MANKKTSSGKGFSNSGPVIFFLLMTLVRLIFFEYEPVISDEVSTIQMSKLPLSEMVRHFSHGTREFGQMPLSFILARLSLVSFERTIFWLRMPFFVCGIMGLVLLYLWAARFLGRQSAFLLALLMTICPAHVEQSHLARFYPIMFLAAVLLYWGLLEMVRKPDIFWMLTLAGAMLIGLYNHYFALVLTGLSFVTWFFFWLRPPQGAVRSCGRKEWRKKTMVYLSLTALLVFIGYSPWSGRLFEFLSFRGAAMYATPGLPQAKSGPVIPLSAHNSPLPEVGLELSLTDDASIFTESRNPLTLARSMIKYYCGSWISAIILMPLLLAGYLYSFRRFPIMFYIVSVVGWGTFLFLGIILNYTRHMFHPRYTFYLLPLLYFMAVFGLKAMVGKIRILMAGTMSSGKTPELHSGKASLSDTLIKGVVVITILLVIIPQGRIIMERMNWFTVDTSSLFRHKLELHLNRLDAFFQKK